MHIPDKTAPAGISGIEREAAAATITAPDQLPSHLCADPASLIPVARAFPMRINAYFLSLLKGPHDPLSRQVVPDTRELRDLCTNADPLAEEA